MEYNDNQLDNAARELYEKLGGVEIRNLKGISFGKADRFAQGLLEEQRQFDALRFLLAQLVEQISLCLHSMYVTRDGLQLKYSFAELQRIFRRFNEEPELSDSTLVRYRGGTVEKKKMENIDYETAVTGAPVIKENAIATIEAKVISSTDAGKTHTIFIAEVVAAEVLRQEEPMTYAYYQEVKRGTTPKTAPSYQEKETAKDMGKYECNVCGYVYDPETGDPENNIIAGTSFEDLPDDWHCPVCGAGKSEFKKI